MAARFFLLNTSSMKRLIRALFSSVDIVETPFCVLLPSSPHHREQNGSSLMFLELLTLRPAPNRQWSRRSLPYRLCLFLTRPHYPREHTRRKGKWRHVGK